MAVGLSMRVFLVSMTVFLPSLSHALDYNTLDGKPPLIVARGGESVLFPDMTIPAYANALERGSDYIHCAVVMTKDDIAICRPSINLLNNTDVAKRGAVLEAKLTNYEIDGVNVTGVFSVDFTYDEILDLRASQPLLYRTAGFDGGYPPLVLEAVLGMARNATPPRGLYIELLSPLFFSSRGLNSANYVLNLLLNNGFSSRTDPIVVSSPTLSSLTFLRNNSDITLALQLRGDSGSFILEPTTGKPYSYFVSTEEGLAQVKAVADAILLPKSYVFPSINFETGKIANNSVIHNIHKASLLAHVSGFANDDPAFSLNWKGDPINEYIAYLNSNYSYALGSPDAILTDNPTTAIFTQTCYRSVTPSSHSGSFKGLPSSRPIILGGAEGILPAQTEASYRLAVEKGVDVITCTVQMTNDSVPICGKFPDLSKDTDILLKFPLYPTASYPSIQSLPGIFSFDVDSSFILNNLSAIQYFPFRPQPSNNFPILTVESFLRLRESLNRSVAAMLKLEFPMFLKERNLNVVDAVLAVVQKFNFSVPDELLLESYETGALLELSNRTTHPLVKRIDFVPLVDPTTNLTFSDYISKEGLTNISQYATFLNVFKYLVASNHDTESDVTLNYFLNNETYGLVPYLHSYRLKVLVFDFSAEAVSLNWDFLGDSSIELNYIAEKLGVDGVSHQFPASASSFFNLGFNEYENVCYNQTGAYNITDVDPGAYLKLAKQVLDYITGGAQAPAPAPVPAPTTAPQTPPSPLPPQLSPPAVNGKSPPLSPPLPPLTMFASPPPPFIGSTSESAIPITMQGTSKLLLFAIGVICFFGV